MFILENFRLHITRIVFLLCSIIPMFFYGRNDISLGEFLTRYCFRSVSFYYNSITRGFFSGFTATIDLIDYVNGV
jgi:hypothetical protein